MYSLLSAKRKSFVSLTVPCHSGLKFKTEHIFAISNTTKIEVWVCVCKCDYGKLISFLWSKVKEFNIHHLCFNLQIGINFQTIGFSTKASKCVLTICDEAVARLGKVKSCLFTFLPTSSLVGLSGDRDLIAM